MRKLDGEILADMTEIQQITLLKGGRGGKGNTFFATAVNQAPDKAQPGEPGIETKVIFELKLIADVGIIGFQMLENQLSYPVFPQPNQNCRLSIYDPDSKSGSRQSGRFQIICCC